MNQRIHKIRDPIHGFIQLDAFERQVLDSRPFQRLRYIHQLGMTYLVYPGATHNRFEHSLGVMELAGRVFDILTSPVHIHDCVKEDLPEMSNPKQLKYWRYVLRAAALCHDIGHLPFSHTAEKELLPEGWDHERLSRKLIVSEEMASIWSGMDIDPLDVVRLAVGPKEAPDLRFTPWQAILSEVVTGDAFGVDRMDYLLRDSYHSGVAYGRFDHFRLIDTLRILPSHQTDTAGTPDCTRPTLGIIDGGIQSAEALLLARYFMYSQVYLHPLRRIYDIHLKDFLSDWLGYRNYPIDPEGHLALTDCELIVAIRDAVKDPGKKGHIHADRLLNRTHFKILYQRNPEDMSINADASKRIFQAAKEKFGQDNVRFDLYQMSGSVPNFPVLMTDDRVTSALSLSQPMNHIPRSAIDFVCIHPDFYGESLQWLKTNRIEIIGAKKNE